MTDIAKSQNGYVVRFDAAKLRSWAIPGTSTRIRLANNWAGFLLVHFLAWYNRNIEPITGKVLDDWGWAVRPIRGKTTGYSNHASGTAVDVNALQYPRGTTHMSLVKKAKIRARLLAYKGCIRWGGDYKNSPTDEMHYEINKPYATVTAFSRRIAGKGWGKLVMEANPDFAKAVVIPSRKQPTLSRILGIGNTGTAVVSLQHALKVNPADGRFGKQTQAAVKRFQRSHGLKADGKVGPATARKLGWKWVG